MATLRDIKNRIAGVSSIEKITSAMKMVSSIKSRRAQKQAESARPYITKIKEILDAVANSQDIISYENPLLQPKTEKVANVAIIIVAGDKGMCGSFNSNLFKIVDTYLKEGFHKLYPAATPHLILFGNKPTDYYTKQKYDILGSFPNAFQSLDYSVVEKIHSLVLNDYISGNIDVVEVFYNKFINVMKQLPLKLQLLPLEFNIADNQNKENQDKSSESNVNYIFEPNKKEIFDTLINQYLGLNIWGPILESNAAEQAARLIAMDKATQNANDLIKELELQFNNARQAAITTEMLEIIGGAESLRKQ